MNKRKGISLIVLVITILVMLILSGVVIVSLSKNNPVKKAKEATFKTDVSTFEGDLSFYLANGLAENSTLKMEDVDAVGYSEIKKVINSFAEKYADKFEVVDGKLIYIGEDKDELVWIGELGISTKEGIVNAPVLSSGMIPIKYNGTKWVICDSKDPEWYNYESKKWANVMLSDGKYKAKTVGTVVEDSDLGSMFVWIPRYAYSINKYKTAPTDTEGQTQLIHDITFLTGTSNSDVDGKTYGKSYDAKNAEVGKPTPKIVHPAFNFGGVEKRGIWVAKFEASMNESGTGHTNQNTNASCNFTDANHSMVKVVPGNVTWRYISVGNAFHNCFNMTRTENVYGISGIDSHLMKNSEWGAVTYLATSKYGSTPVCSNKYNKVDTGNNGYIIWSGGGENGSYRDNKLQSTTGNETGIYDMNGNAWEYVGAYYDNSNNRLLTYGGSILFTGNTLNSAYAKYFDKYEVGEKEKNTSLHNAIWNSSFDDSTYGNSYRKSITDERFNLMSNKHGDGIYESTLNNAYAFFGKKTDNNYDWIKNLVATNFEEGLSIYNNDYTLIGNIYLPFLMRGGHWWDVSRAGIFASHGNSGDPYYGNGFRPVIVNN